MNPGAESGLLQIVSAAVTPVVLISACAALILGVNNKHTAIADRLRVFAGERRAGCVTPERDHQVAEQIRLFFVRFRLTWISLALLYSAIVAFVVMILIILLDERGRLHNPGNAIPLFVTAITLVLVAIAMEIWEVALSIDCIEIEIEDVKGPGNVSGK